MLVIFTGLPGTGKSTLARRVAETLSLPYFSKDSFEARLFEDGFTEGNSIHGYHLLLDAARLQLSLSVGAVVDAVFPLPGFRQELFDMARDHQTDCKIIHTLCSDDDLHRQRLADRPVTVPWSPPDWDEVLRLREMYTEWSQPVLRVDAVHPLEHNVERVLVYLR